MISTAEIHRRAESEGLRFDQVEKDYVIVHLLAGIAATAACQPVWVFKGGTCLRHCYYEGYRFSEDLDVSSEETLRPADSLKERVAAAARIVEERSGMELRLKKARSSEGEQQVEIAVEYNRGGARRQGLPSVKQFRPRPHERPDYVVAIASEFRALNSELRSRTASHRPAHFLRSSGPLAACLTRPAQTYGLGGVEESVARTPPAGILRRYRYEVRICRERRIVCSSRSVSVTCLVISSFKDLSGIQSSRNWIRCDLFGVVIPYGAAEHDLHDALRNLHQSVSIFLLTLPEPVRTAHRERMLRRALRRDTFLTSP